MPTTRCGAPRVGASIGGGCQRLTVAHREVVHRGVFASDSLRWNDLRLRAVVHWGAMAAIHSLLAHLEVVHRGVAASDSLCRNEGWLPAIHCNAPKCGA